MRAKRAIWISGGVLVLAVCLLLLWPGRVSVVLLYAIDGAYMVEAKNTTASNYFLAAWSECQRNGQWMPETPEKYTATLKPSESRTFKLPKPEHGRARIAILCNRLSGKELDHLREKVSAWFDHYPRATQTYIEP